MSSTPTITAAPSTSSPASVLVGPLSTTYTPTGLGEECHNIFYANNPVNEWLAWGAIGPSSTDCMPSGFNRATQYYYSPGVCPTGWSPACSQFVTSNSAVQTVATCCPNGFVCFGNRPSDQIYGCTSRIISDTVLSIRSASFATDVSNSTTSYPIIYASTTMTFTASETQVAAYGIIIKRESNDPTWAATSTAASGSAASTGGTGDVAAAATATASSSSSSSGSGSGSLNVTSSSSGMSSGAKAGVGIGVTLGVLALLAGLFFLFRRMRNGARNPAVAPQPAVAGHTELQQPNEKASGVPVDPYYGDYQNVPQYTSPTRELDASHSIMELNGGQNTQFYSELPDSSFPVSKR